MNNCNSINEYGLCKREGKLVQQFVHFVNRDPFVFRHYLCRYHLASYNRYRLKNQRKLIPIEYVEDSELLQEVTTMKENE